MEDMMGAVAEIALLQLSLRQACSYLIQTQKHNTSAAVMMHNAVHRRTANLSNSSFASCRARCSRRPGISCNTRSRKDSCLKRMIRRINSSGS